METKRGFTLIELLVVIAIRTMKTELQLMAKGLNLLLASLLAVAGGGCDTIQDHSLTYALWSDNRDTSHCRPQADPDLKLFAAKHPPEVLVEYKAVSDRSQGVQRRAYFLHANAGRLAACKPPRFVDFRREAGLAPIPIVPSESKTNSPVCTNAVFAVCQADTFTLVRSESSPEFCLLPYYQDGIVVHSWKSVALTPFAVTVDTVVDVGVIGAAAGCLALYAFCAGNTAWRP